MHSGEVPVILVTVEDGRVSGVFSNQPGAVRVVVADFDAERNGDEWLWDENVFYPARDAIDDDAWLGLCQEAKRRGIAMPAIDRG